VGARLSGNAQPVARPCDPPRHAIDSSTGSDHRRRGGAPAGFPQEPARRTRERGT
jgi:hypothetical protein